MGAPSGCSGVHAVPKAGHSWGFLRPRSTSPAMQSGDSSACTEATSNRRSASKAANAGVRP